MGRRAKPVELHLLHGKKHLTKKEIRERQEGEARIRPPADKVRPPTWLSREAKRVFRRIVKDLEGTEILANPDVHTLAVLADAMVKHAQATDQVEREGFTVVGAQGGMIQNPAVLVATKYAQIISRLAPRFGLDPSGRASLALPRDTAKPKDEFGEMFDGGHDSRRNNRVRPAGR